MASASNPGETRTTTPSPPTEYGDTSVMGGNSSEVEVPSPLPASTGSTTTASSEPSHSHHGTGSGTPSASYVVTTSVPNPFAAATPAPPPPGWGSHVYETGNPAAPPPPSSYPTHHHHHHHPHHHPHHQPVPMIVSAPRAPPPPAAPAPAPSYSHHHHHTPHTWARENSCPNLKFSIGTTEPKSPVGGGATAAGTKGGVVRRRYSKASTSSSSTATTTTTTTSTSSNTSSSVNNTSTVTDATSSSSGAGGGVGDTVNSRRQKRLERNRESARLSRRRRKQYLEILEDRVTQLSTEVDQGRRSHAAQAITITLHKRREILEAPERTNEERLSVLDHGLGRTSAEMMLVSTFNYQQLKSFSLPPQSKFILWLTLQNDQYFRGGRAASERLSAARIGERMLNSGNDRVPPAQSMWPLFCNEVGLSYDQEERVRNFQRTLLQSHESWLERHSARAADLAMVAVHDSTQAMSLRLGQREKSMLQVLTPAQRVKFLSWAEKNRDKLQRLMQAKVSKHMATNKSAFVDDRFKIDKKQHVAANLYIVNYRLQRVMQVIPRAAPLVTGSTLKKLSRRPSFESLGRSPSDKPGKEGEEQGGLGYSYASSGSLKRSASALSMDGDRPQLLQISPDDAEETCRPTVDKVLGYLREIIPPTPPIQYGGHPTAKPPQQIIELRIPSPTQVTSAPYHPPQPQLQPQYMQHPVPTPVPTPHQPGAQAPVPMSIVSTHPGAPPPVAQPTLKQPGHKKQSSFIPPYLNVVPEEMFPNDGTADEFLMSLVDEDWAIGEGIDMDTTE